MTPSIRLNPLIVPMKLVTILAGIILPLIAGALGFVISYIQNPVESNAATVLYGPSKAVFVIVLIIYALVGGLTAAVLSLKSCARAAWISIGVVVALCGATSASIWAISVRRQEREHEAFLARQSAAVQAITLWGQQHRGDVSVTLAKCGWPQIEDIGLYGKRIYVDGISFEGSITNNSAEKIVAVVIDLSIINKEQNRVVISRRLMIPIEVFPTVSAAFERRYQSSTGANDNLCISELQRANAQLGASSAWRYEIVAIVPQSLDDVYADIGFKVDAMLFEKR